MCSNEVKTGSTLYLDINIKPADNINNCSCILQLIKPGTDTGQTYPVTFTPLYPNQNNWCYYSLTVTDGSLTEIYDCTHRIPLIQFQLTETVDILLYKELGQGDRNVTRCVNIETAAGNYFTISCSLPNNQSPPTVTTPYVSPVTTRDTNAPMLTSSITSISTIVQGNKTPSPIGGTQTPYVSPVTTRDTNAPMLTSSITSISTIVQGNKTPSPIGGTQTGSNAQETQVGAIIGGVLGVILVIGGVLLAILVWRCYRAKIPDEDTNYSSLDLQNNINPADMTYQSLQTNLSSNQPAASTAEVCENRSTNKAFSTDEDLASNQPTFTDETETNHSLSSPPTYENQSRPIGPTNINPDPGEQILNHQHYENLTSNEPTHNHSDYERLTSNQQASTDHVYGSLHSAESCSSSQPRFAD
ncbi:uncharacterized protein LOC126811729 [Patella vulgata]|uniref:uncharacterized protein LOC126811729 n=1 Tax=Patella vulgata TaxID=6465 RepID=UPI00217F7665|nr:uncharacterized protein LOC126811729 [Patella vulgata]